MKKRETVRQEDQKQQAGSKNCSTPNCCQGTDRRTFVKLTGAGVASISGLLAGQSAWAQQGTTTTADHYVPAEKNLDSRWVRTLFEKGRRGPYRGAQLTTLGMPCGGICAGQLYVRGDGTLAHWWIANDAYNTAYGIGEEITTPLGNYPQAYAAAKADLSDNEHAAIRPFSPVEQGFAIRIQAAGEDPQVRQLNQDDFDNIQFFGEYPIATIHYGVKEKPLLPVDVRAEVFSPFSPLNSRDSAMPVTVMRYSFTNTSKKPVEISIGGWLQNAVFAELWGRVAAECQNSVVRHDGLTSLGMSVVEDRQARRPERHITLFEDFESGNLGKWTSMGTAFGNGPASEAPKDYPDLSGWQGKYFASSGRGGDASAGRLISQPFTITESYLAFRIGGGRYPEETGIHLVVDGKVRRTAAGFRRPALRTKYWDVREFFGKQARLEIVDGGPGIWAHINVDEIYLTNLPPLDEEPFSRDHPRFGDMALTVLDPDAAASAAWESKEAFLAQLARDGTVKGPTEARHPLGERTSGVLLSSFRLQPGLMKEVTFLLTWYFPNRQQHNQSAEWGQPSGVGRQVGNMYGNWFSDSLNVAAHVSSNLERLVGDTFLFRDTYFDTTLPYWFVHRIAMPLANLATETCQWWANGRFWAWEGVGCCFGTCNHVWNYSQGLARLFPELERSVREMQDLGEALDLANGAVGHRGAQTFPALDGQAGTVLKTYREHLVSVDRTFVERNWQKVKLALEWLIGHDENSDGLIEGTQANTYDIAFVGANTFVGSLYLGALRAGEEMAREMGEPVYASQLRTIFEIGSRATVERLWNGEYFIQDVDLDEHPKSQYSHGCLADQLFGQAWARQVGVGFLYPGQYVRSALQAIWKYNWAPDVAAQNKAHPPERSFVRKGEGGLFNCTWPKSSHMGENGVRYRDEVWTGIEYQVAAHMLYEGMAREGLAIVRAIHERYDGANRNPWNEVECGDHYARSLASWGCLLGACGYLYNGPQGLIGFAPRLEPENFKAFFTAAEGWGSLIQTRQQGIQLNRIEVKWGRLRVAKVIVELPENTRLNEVSVLTRDGRILSRGNQDQKEVTITLDSQTTLERGDYLEARLEWKR